MNLLSPQAPRRFLVLFLGFILLLTLLAAALTPAQAATNGRNVNVVEFGDGSQMLGTYRQTSQKGWVEQNKQGQNTFSFRETHRDDWSVYLEDASRQVALQLDLHRKVVGYRDAQNPQMRDQYKIRSSSSKLSGWLVREARFKNGGTLAGAYVQKGAVWNEISLPSKAVAFTFQEDARDDWSVYLTDPSRDVHIQLDLHTKKVMYSEGSGPRRVLYDIAGTR